MKTLVTGAVCLAACAMMVSDPVFGLDDAQTYSYDFADGAGGWELDDNWSLTTWDPGGQALLGTNDGVAFHTEGSGTVREVSLRFEMDQTLPYFCLTFGGPGGPAGLSYTVCLEANGVGLTSRSNEATHELAFVPFSVEGGLPHSVTVLTGDGSLDVFVDGVGVVGVDAADPAPGSLSLLAGPKSVIIDDVEIVLGGDGSGHDRAPRPVEDMAPGPDVGPFVGGKASGGFTLSGSERLELSGGRYVVTDGNIVITENAELVVAEDGVLAFGLEGSPLLHFGIYVSGDAALRVHGGRVAPFGHGPLIVASAGDRGTIEIRDSAPWFHFIQAEGDATMMLENVRLLTSVGGQVTVGGNADVAVAHAVLGSIAFDVPPGMTLRADGLVWDRYLEDFDFRRDLDVEGAAYDLTLQDVVLHPSTMTDGANEKGWVVSADNTSTLELTDSEIGKLNLSIAAGADEFRVSGLKVAEPVDFSYRSILFDEVSVTQQWGFFIFGTRRAVFEDSEGVWLFVFDEVDAVLRRTTMSEFDPRDYTGTVTFEEGKWESAACEIIENNDFTLRGSVTTTAALRNCSWSESTMNRVYDIRLLDAAGTAVAEAELTAARGDQTVTATTDETGAASFTFTFDDEDRFSAWTITGPGDAEASVDAFDSSPVVMWTSRPPDRVRQGPTGRVTP